MTGASMRFGRSPGESGGSAAGGVAIPLAACVAAGAVVAAGLGLFAGGGAVPASLPAEATEPFGRGLYRMDTTFQAAGSRGTDAVTLAIAVPLLIATTLAHARGSLRGGVAFLGALVWFLYVYGGYALGVVAYNEAFLLHVALFGASLFAFVATFRALEAPLAPHVHRLPRSGLAAFMLVSGAATFAIWIVDPVRALLRGAPPDALAQAGTLFTYAVDLAVIVPAALVAWWAIRRGRTLGPLVAVPLLTLEALLFPTIAAQTAFQLAAGVAFTPGEVIGPIGGFVVLSLVSISFLVRVLRPLPGGAAAPRAARGAAG